MYKYFIEFLGVLVIVYATLLTDGNPAVMGITYFAVFTIGKQNADKGYFTPLDVIANYGLSRLTLHESLYYILAQLLATGAVLVTFIPLKTLMDSV